MTPPIPEHLIINQSLRNAVLTSKPVYNFNGSSFTNIVAFYKWFVYLNAKHLTNQTFDEILNELVEKDFFLGKSNHFNFCISIGSVNYIYPVIKERWFNDNNEEWFTMYIF